MCEVLLVLLYTVKKSYSAYERERERERELYVNYTWFLYSIYFHSLSCFVIVKSKWFLDCPESPLPWQNSWADITAIHYKICFYPYIIFSIASPKVSATKYIFCLFGISYSCIAASSGMNCFFFVFSVRHSL